MAPYRYSRPFSSGMFLITFFMAGIQPDKEGNNNFEDEQLVIEPMSLKRCLVVPHRRDLFST